MKILITGSEGYIGQNLKNIWLKRVLVFMD